MLRLRKPLNFTFKRLMSTTKMIFEQLNERSLIRLSGTEVSDYIQGLITNDIKHLSNGPGSMYSMFLNSKGRVMYDIIVYRTIENDTFLIECDKSITQQLQKHLKLYRVKRKIDIVDLQDDYKVFVLFNPNLNNSNGNRKCDNLDGLIVPCDRLNESLPQNFVKIHSDLMIFKDPRINDLGSRIIVKSDANNVNEQINEIVQLENNTTNRSYRWLRYSLGVGEGINDIPPNISFPLECNCDYLHGVSFHKGCYIGQELTARVHHTGVVRKRLMPINFEQSPTIQIQQEDVIYQNENLGKLRGIENNVGLGLFRIEKVLKFDRIQIGDGTAVVHKPNWWPIEAPKEKVTTQKLQ